MRRFDAAVAKRIQEAVARAEGGCDLEIVVRVVPASGGYRDVAAAVGAVVATISLALVLFAPFVVSPWWVLPDVVLTGLVATWLAARVPSLLRALTPPARLRSQALTGARAAFHEEAVGATRRRTGVLVFATVLEDEVLLLLDHPLEGRAPKVVWDTVAQAGARGSADLAERILHVIEELGRTGGRHVPALADNPNELPDAPRIG
jgi:uncharacterized membrane protein